MLLKIISNNENYQNSIYYALTHEIAPNGRFELHPSQWQCDMLAITPRPVYLNIIQFLKILINLKNKFWFHLGQCIHPKAYGESLLELVCL